MPRWGPCCVFSRFLLVTGLMTHIWLTIFLVKRGFVVVHPSHKVFIYTICNSQHNCNQKIFSLQWCIIINVKILCSFGHMMQVFFPWSLLVLVGIPLWPHQLILWYFPVSFSQTLFISFDFYSHICSFLSQYPFNSPLLILGFWVTVIGHAIW